MSFTRNLRRRNPRDSDGDTDVTDVPTDKVQLTELGGGTPTSPVASGELPTSPTEKFSKDELDGTTTIAPSMRAAVRGAALTGEDATTTIVGEVEDHTTTLASPDDLDDATYRMAGKDLARVLRKMAPTPHHPVKSVPESHAQAGSIAGQLPLPALPERTPAPRTLGGYRITGTLASGGMGIVYRAESARRQPVAIKALQGQKRHDPAIIARFFGESIATSRVLHPNVVRFYDFGYDANGSAFLVMELLEGETLSKRLERERALEIPVAVDIACQIAQGLQAAHAQGVIHRDLKPDNIFLCSDPHDPGAVLVKLIDFGVAKVEGQGPTQTLAGDLLGTPAYMAPEQGRSAADSDARSDIYSLGCILFEMVCGVVPFPGSVVETLVAHQTAERPPARALNPRVPLAIDDVLDRLLARDPMLRTQSAAEVATALSAIGSRIGVRTSSVRLMTMMVDSRPGLARLPTHFLVLGAAAVILAIVVVFLLLR